jgi:hypothetical protein
VLTDGLTASVQRRHEQCIDRRCWRIVAYSAVIIWLSSSYRNYVTPGTVHVPPATAISPAPHNAGRHRRVQGGPFKPEYAGKLNFYLSVTDALLRTTSDAPTLGLLLCVATCSSLARRSPLGASTRRRPPSSMTPCGNTIRSPPNAASTWMERRYYFL